MFHFHKVAYISLREVNMCFMLCKDVLPAYSSAKIIKITRVFPELWSQMCCHVFWLTDSLNFIAKLSHWLSVTKITNIRPPQFQPLDTI